MDRVDDERYAAPQIALHWAIVALIVVQWLSHDAMEDFWDEAAEGGAPALPGDPAALLHAGSGATILILMLVRFAVRLGYGAPPAPRDLGPALKILARFNHYAFYVVLILMPLTGATALLFGVEASAEFHGLLFWVLFLLIVLHLAGVAYHMAVLRDGLIWRMLKPRQAERAGNARGAHHS